MLLNLVLNAIQALHGSEDEGVSIRLHADGFSVSDNGLASERREDLFEAFASSRNDGTGLGLHLAHLIAEAHGAELSYRDLTPQAVVRPCGTHKLPAMKILAISRSNPFRS